MSHQRRLPFLVSSRNHHRHSSAAQAWTRLRSGEVRSRAAARATSHSGRSRSSSPPYDPVQRAVSRHQPAVRIPRRQLRAERGQRRARGVRPAAVAVNVSCSSSRNARARSTMSAASDGRRRARAAEAVDIVRLEQPRLPRPREQRVVRHQPLRCRRPSSRPVSVLTNASARAVSTSSGVTSGSAPRARHDRDSTPAGCNQLKMLLTGYATPVML